MHIRFINLKFTKPDLWLTPYNVWNEGFVQNINGPKYKCGHSDGGEDLSNKTQHYLKNKQWTGKQRQTDSKLIGEDRAEADIKSKWSAVTLKDTYA